MGLWHSSVFQRPMLPFKKNDANKIQIIFNLWWFRWEWNWNTYDIVFSRIKAALETRATLFLHLLSSHYLAGQAWVDLCSVILALSCHAILLCTVPNITGDMYATCECSYWNLTETLSWSAKFLYLLIPAHKDPTYSFIFGGILSGFLASNPSSSGSMSPAACILTSSVWSFRSFSRKEDGRKKAAGSDLLISLPSSMPFSSFTLIE